MNSRSKAFTLVELIVVITVIGIIAAVTILGLSRYQNDSRDTKRASSAVVISEALEQYYEQNGEYPSCNTIQQSATVLTTDVLKGVQKTALAVPGATVGTNSLKCQVLSTASADFFEYLGDGSTDCVSSGCLYFAIRYKEEATNTIKTIESRHSPEVDTPQNIAANVDSSTQVTVNWDAVENVTNYTLQRSDTDDFPEDSTTTSYSQPGLSKVFTDESPGGTHFYRVQALRGSSPSRWSDIVNATPKPNAPTDVLAVNSSSTGQTISWTPSSGSSNTYSIRQSTASNFSGSTVVASGLSGSPQLITGLNQGIHYYYKVYATANGQVSDPSSLTDAVTPIDAPVAYSITTSTSTTTVTATSQAICPVGTTAYYTWVKNNVAWQEGTTLKTVSNAPGTNTNVTMRVNTRCQTVEAQSADTQSTNTVSFTAGVAAPSINLLQRNGSRVWARWNNICGGTYQLYLVQGGYTEYTPPHWNSTNNPWTSSGVVEMPYSENDTRAWASTPTVTYKVRALCGGNWSSWSGSVSV